MIWLPITDSLPTQEIDAVAIDPNNLERVVIATDAGVFESPNQGSVWTLQRVSGAGVVYRLQCVTGESERDSARILTKSGREK